RPPATLVGTDDRRGERSRDGGDRRHIRRGGRGARARCRGGSALRLGGSPTGRLPNRLPQGARQGHASAAGVGAGTAGGVPARNPAVCPASPAGRSDAGGDRGTGGLERGDRWAVVGRQYLRGLIFTISVGAVAAQGEGIAETAAGPCHPSRFSLFRIPRGDFSRAHQPLRYSRTGR